jgi:signal transduction histidine kinase
MSIRSVTQPSEADRLRREVRRLRTIIAQAQIEAGAAERRLALALRHAEAGWWEWRRVLGGRVTCSPECGDLLGRTPETFAPEPPGWIEAVLQEDRARVIGELEAGATGERRELRLEFRVAHPEKGVRWLTWRGHVSRGVDGSLREMAGVLTDSTDHRASETALENMTRELHRQVELQVAAREEETSRLFQAQKMEAIGRLTGGIAHDFNNLLTVVSGGLHLLPRAAADPARQHFLITRMERAVGRGAEVTRRLLAFARQQILQPAVLDLRLRAPVLRALVTSGLREDIAVEIRFAEDLWPIRVDPAALELALLNIASNARDAMPEGGAFSITAGNRRIEARAAYRMGLAAGDFAEIACTDTGHGMPPEVLSRVFEPFYTTKGIGEGSGLGLPQVQGFASQSGGTAWAESAPGAGATVYLLLPRWQGEAPA